MSNIDAKPLNADTVQFKAVAGKTENELIERNTIEVIEDGEEEKADI